VERLETILINFPIMFANVARRINPEIASTMIAHGSQQFVRMFETG
jgi:hypothetical protein